MKFSSNKTYFRFLLAPSTIIITLMYDVLLAAPSFTNLLLQNDITTIFSQCFKHALALHGSVFGTTCIAFSSTISNEPTCYNQLQTTGLISVILDMIVKEEFPNDPKSLLQLPSLLSAICLNKSGLKRINDEPKRLQKLFTIVANPDYQQSFKLISGQYGGSVEELLRHHPSLRIYGVVCTIELLKQILLLGNDPACSTPEKQEQLLNVLQSVSKFLKPILSNHDHRVAFAKKRV